MEKRLHLLPITSNSIKPKPGTLKSRLHNVAIGLVLLALSGWLDWRLLDGTLSYYLHPRFNLLIALTGLFLTFGGGWLIWQQLGPTTFRPVVGIKVVLPVALAAIIGLVTAPQPLSNTGQTSQNYPGAALSNRSVNQALTEIVQKQDWNNPAKLDTGNWNLLDWSAALNNTQRAALLVGAPVDVTGFVIQLANKNERAFLIARYVVVCCTADSTALRLPVVTAKNVELAEGQWVRVRGAVVQGTNGGIGFSASTVELVAQPAQPYIYP